MKQNGLYSIYIKWFQSHNQWFLQRCIDSGGLKELIDCLETYQPPRGTPEASGVVSGYTRGKIHFEPDLRNKNEILTTLSVPRLSSLPGGLALVRLRRQGKSSVNDESDIEGQFEEYNSGATLLHLAALSEDEDEESVATLSDEEEDADDSSIDSETISDEDSDEDSLPLCDEEYCCGYSHKTGTTTECGSFIRRLVEEFEIPVDVVDDMENIPLHYACKTGALSSIFELIRLSLRYGFSLETTNNLGEAPLHFAAQRKDERPALMLLGHGCNGNLVTKSGATTLHKAANSKVIQVLLEHGGDPNAKDNEGTTPLHLAVRREDVQAVRTLLSKGADVNLTDNSAIPQKGRTALHAVVDTRIARTLLSHGADANIKDDEGMTALHRAVSFGMRGTKASKSLVYLLLRVADVDSENLKKETPLHLAVALDKVSIAKALLRAEAKTNVKDKDGMTPLHIACTCEDTKMLRFLLKWEKFAKDLNSRSALGETPLHFLCKAGKTRAVKLCDKLGASFDIKNNNGKRPRDVIKNHPFRDDPTLVYLKKRARAQEVPCV